MALLTIETTMTTLLHEIQIGSFVVKGTKSIIGANKAVQRAIKLERLSRNSVSYQVGSKTVTLKLKP